MKNKEKNLMGLLLLFAFLISGCINYGSGKSYGYITSVAEGWIYEDVWIRAELESSNTDCYVLADELVDYANQMAIQKQRVEILYERHLISLGCSTERVVKIIPISDAPYQRKK